MISIKPAQQAPRALPSFAPRPCGVPASTATGDFAALMRAAGQASPPVRSTGSVGQAEWLAQASRRPDIEAALSQLHLARRVPVHEQDGKMSAQDLDERAGANGLQCRRGFFARRTRGDRPPWHPGARA